MQDIAYITFLRHLPPALQDGLSVKTLGGTEIALQVILRVDHEFFAFKGRLAGTQDTGRVFFIPYTQIDHLFYQKEVREEDFSAAFDGLHMPAPAELAPAAGQARAEEPAPDESPAEEAADSLPVNRPTPVPMKSAVLDASAPAPAPAMPAASAHARRRDSPGRAALVSSAVWPAPKRLPPKPRRGHRPRSRAPSRAAASASASNSPGVGCGAATCAASVPVTSAACSNAARATAPTARTTSSTRATSSSSATSAATTSAQRTTPTPGAASCRSCAPAAAELLFFSLLFAVLAGMSASLGAYVHPLFFWVLLPVGLLWAFVASFFRDPERIAPADPAAVVSPADGTVTHVEEVSEPDFPGGRALRVSIFLSVFNVHVNRNPRSGRVTQLRYFPGAFLDARDGGCAVRNEQFWVDYEDAATGAPIRVKQIAGAIARRIVCWLRPGEEVTAGTRFGMIKFGSRTDLLLPVAVVADLRVKVGDSVRGGSTVVLRVTTK